MSAFCPACGNPVKANDRFCRRCGANVADASDPAASPAAHATDNAVHVDGRVAAFAAAFLIVAVLGAVGAWMLARNSMDSAAPVDDPASGIVVTDPNGDDGADIGNGEAAPPATVVPPEPDGSGYRVAAGDVDAMAGALDAEGFTVAIPAGSFADATEVRVAVAADVPPVPPNEIELRQTLDVTTGAPTRLDAPTTLTYRVTDAADLEALASGDLWGAYYDGTNWNYYPPTSVDLDAGTLSFETFHFSLQGYGKIDVEKRLAEYTHSQAVASTLQSNVVDETVDQIISQAVEHVLRDQLGIEDSSVTSQIVSSLTTDDSLRDLVNQLRSGQVTDFVQTLNVAIGKKIVDNVESSVLSDALDSVAGAPELVAASAQAAGYLAEGQPAEAARILGEQIADDLLVTTIAKGAVEVVQHQIDVWKDAEIEAAFEAYKNGADGVFWGYNVEPGRFDDLYNQMRGIAVRLEGEAVQAEIARREAAQMRPATDAELDAVREKAKQEIKRQFDERIAKENDIAEREAEFKVLIDKLRDAKLLEPGRFGFNDELDSLETRLDKLLHLSNKILRDTGREGWTEGSFTTPQKVSSAEMAILIQKWYSGGREAYNDEIFKRFGIVLDAAPIAGPWSGTLTLTELVVDEPTTLPDGTVLAPGTYTLDELEAIIEACSDSAAEQFGADVTSGIADLSKGTSLNVVFTGTREAPGTVTMSGGDQAPQTVPWRIEGATIRWDAAGPEGALAFTGTVQGTVMTGTWRAALSSTDVGSVDMAGVFTLAKAG